MYTEGSFLALKGEWASEYGYPYMGYITELYGDDYRDPLPRSLKHQEGSWRQRSHHPQPRCYYWDLLGLGLGV